MVDFYTFASPTANSTVEMLLLLRVVTALLFTPHTFQKNSILSDVALFAEGQQGTDSIFGSHQGLNNLMKLLKINKVTSDVYLNQIFEFPVVKTKLGRVRGTITKSSRDRTPYTAFMGIPYAEPPIGHLRFQRPIPKQPWPGILDATEEGETCYTFLHPDKASEDCLFLNVYTPITKFPAEKPLKAVMVFIIGGAFINEYTNTTSYGADFLIDKDVVVVDFNYRVGPLGFLSLNNEDVPGNAGLKDQSVALRWVKKNIEYFGGDPNNITIFGQSSGGASVIYHLISPWSRGLFARGIAESGVALMPGSYQEPEVAVLKAFIFGKAVGCDYKLTEKKKLHKCLLKIPAFILTTKQLAVLSKEEFLQDGRAGFVPTAEPKSAIDPFMTKHPEKYLRSGEFEKKPIIMGVVSAEGTILYQSFKFFDPFGTYVAGLSKDLASLAPVDIRATLDVYSPKLENALERFYLRNTTEPVMNILNIVSDVHYFLPVMRVVKILKDFTDIYLYLFSFQGQYNYRKQTEHTMHLNGASHSDELGYLFNIPKLSEYYNHENRDTPEERVLDEITTLWTNFAKTGQPSTMWEPFREKDGNYLEITVPLQVKHHLARENVTFWNSIYENILNIRPF